MCYTQKRIPLGYKLGFPVAQMVKHLPAVQETRAQPLGREDPLKEGMVTHSSILAWETPWTEKPGRLRSMGLQRVGHEWVTNTYIQRYKLIHNIQHFLKESLKKKTKPLIIIV